MKEDFQRLCERFADNKKLLSKTFKLSESVMNMTASLLITGSGITISEEKIKECDKILREMTSAVSDYRGNIRVPLVCKMLISGMPAEAFKLIDQAYKALKTQKKWPCGNEYKMLAAMIIYDHAGQSEYKRYAERTNEIYLKMKEQHRAITRDEDVPFAAILATSGVNSDKLIDDMEACFTLLLKKFHSKNSVQSLCQVLALDERTPEEKCSRVIEIYDALKKAGHKFGTDFELTTLGTLAMLDRPVDEIVTLLGEADDFLKPIRGFGDFSLGAKNRRLFAAQLCVNYLCPKQTKGKEFAMGSTLALTISMQVSMTACLSASLAVTAANMH